jgi:hypothetical protein
VGQTFVLYRSSFAYESAPNISHVTVDGVKTLCGRLVSKAATVEPDIRDDEPPDCNSCFRVWFYSRQK